MINMGSKTIFFAGIAAFAIGVIAVGGVLIVNFATSSSIQQSASVVEGGSEAALPKPTPEELLKDALLRSQSIKGVYMTAVVANDPGRAATKLRNDILHLADTTELNAVVVDVKETDGTFLPESLPDFISQLHQKNIWAIARLVVFNDTVQARTHPEMALKRAGGKLWLDRRKNAWLDPASPEAQEYIVRVAKQAIDYGFDEIQFDYIRFPSDGDVENIVYPVFTPKTKLKYEVLRDFFAYANRELKSYRPQIILSADMFGYVATQQNDLGIGQRMEDLGDAFDHISFMLYPSHFYNGFQARADLARGLAELYFPYRSQDITRVASNHPYDIVYRSLLTASDFLAGKEVFAEATTTTAATPPPRPSLPDEDGKEPPLIKGSSGVAGHAATTTVVTRSHAKLRPWLQAFDLGADTSRGIYYTAEMVRAQIQASEDAGASGWLLWNPSNVYDAAALEKE